MTVTDEMLMAYVDDELDAQTRATVEAAMAEDPRLARRVEEQRALRTRLRAAFDPLLEEPPPSHLVALARSAAADGARGNVVSLRRPHTRGGSWPTWLALAASLLLGLIVGRWAFRGGIGPIVTHGGRLVASGLLADALTDQLASTQAVTAPVRIGLSFRSKAGQYCRTFNLHAPRIAGLACHAGADWQLQVLTGAERQSTAPGGYRQAGSAMPPAVVAAVNADISGEPLDAQAERAARQLGWR
jgi:hypothetical protein